MKAKERVEAFNRLWKKWKNCRMCRIGDYAHKHVLGRGSLTAKFLFIGEGPGRSEDALGQPFVGSAGRTLNATLEHAGFLPREYFLTNLVCCRPCDGPKESNRPPFEQEVLNCLARLIRTVEICNPKAIVLLGKVPGGFWHEPISQHIVPMLNGNVKAYQFHHPSYIARRGGRRSSEWQMYVSGFRAMREEVNHLIISRPMA